MDHGLSGFDGFSTDLIRENLSGQFNPWSIHKATQTHDTTSLLAFTPELIYKGRWTS